MLVHRVAQHARRVEGRRANLVLRRVRVPDIEHVALGHARAVRAVERGVPHLGHALQQVDLLGRQVGGQAIRRVRRIHRRGVVAQPQAGVGPVDRHVLGRDELVRRGGAMKVHRALGRLEPVQVGKARGALGRLVRAVQRGRRDGQVLARAVLRREADGGHLHARLALLALAWVGHGGAPGCVLGWRASERAAVFFFACAERTGQAPVCLFAVAV